ncbi:hypothetical protein [Streptomyces radicis]|uniref:Secreted protein n=1 Tax=Streptomyces radicis TaxID=1750517 RepID=A0A3A9VXJ3_9ACTN|nr:hypothetical protein [Streptomyces radicis]RKN04883.1 hypothetical protein D7319_27180 [Streptomyces radicis]RKN25393.1 hypothetical protein D7318_09340 [Streptomyces radicis]
MNTATRVGAFGAGIVLAFGAAFGLGRVVDPVTEDEPEPAAHAADHAPDEGNDDGNGEAHGDGHGEQAAAEAPGGLQVSERGYTLAPPAEALPAGEETDFRFRVLGPEGEPLTAYDTSHEKDMHLIVVRRDLSGFQHVHPTLGEDGTWSVPLTFPAGGTYRVFADFEPAGDADGGLTLGADVAVAGEYAPEPLPEPAHTATVDGYTVTLDGALNEGEESELTLSVSREGRPVTDIEPYLGADGHLVVLRSGDLAYLHAHPGELAGGPDITFHTRAPSAGTYRLFLDFQHEGVVRTAEFTVTTGDHGHGDGA